MAYEHGVTLQFIRPSKAVENAYCESFNGKLRDGRLNAKWAVEPRSLPKHCGTKTLQPPSEPRHEWPRIGEDVTPTLPTAAPTRTSRPSK